MRISLPSLGKHVCMGKVYGRGHTSSDLTSSADNSMQSPLPSSMHAGRARRGGAASRRLGVRSANVRRACHPVQLLLDGPRIRAAARLRHWPLGRRRTRRRATRHGRLFVVRAHRQVLQARRTVSAHGARVAWHGSAPPPRAAPRRRSWRRRLRRRPGRCARASVDPSRQMRPRTQHRITRENTRGRSSPPPRKCTHMQAWHM